MKKIDEIRAELGELCEMGKKLGESLLRYDLKKTNDFVYFINNYEQWYSKALVTIKQLAPDRYDDFMMLYKNDKRKALNSSTYTICDAIQAITNEDTFTLDFSDSEKTFKPTTAAPKMTQQLNILAACYERLDSKLYDMKILLQSELFDNEIETTRHLLKNNHLRAAGAVCGVVIETHLGTAGIK